MNVNGIVMFVFGIVACLAGYSMFKSMLPLWGFLLVGWVFMSFAPIFVHVAADQDIWMRIIAFFIGGVIGAIIATPLYFVIIFVSGAALGALAGIMLGVLVDMGGVTSFSKLSEFSSLTFPPQPSTPLQFFFMIILAVILGVMALNFQKFMITASSAFLGAAGIVGGLSGVISRSIETSGIGVLLIFAWLVVGFFGMFVQYRIMGDEV